MTSQTATKSLGEKYLDADFDAWVEGLLAKHRVPGLSLAVVDNGNTVAKVGAHIQTTCTLSSRLTHSSLGLWLCTAA